MRFDDKKAETFKINCYGCDKEILYWRSVVYNRPTDIALCRECANSILGLFQNKRGRIPWNKGLPMREESRKKLSESKKGKLFSKEAKMNMRHEYSIDHLKICLFCGRGYAISIIKKSRRIGNKAFDKQSFCSMSCGLFATWIIRKMIAHPAEGAGLS